MSTLQNGSAPSFRLRAVTSLASLPLAAIMTLGGSAMTDAASAESTCPPALAAAERLMLVTTADMNSTSAIVTTYERVSSADPWRAVGGMREAVVGLKGLAWGAPFRNLALAGEPLKVEGDRRSPAGVYALAQPFGFEAAQDPGYLQLQTDQHICVEDVRSPLYGRIVALSDIEPGIKFDQMRAEPLYRTGMVVDYPPDRERKGGSCIFLHVWRKPGQGTAGCVAMDEPAVTELRAWAAARPSAVAILHTAGKARFAGCLP